MVMRLRVEYAYDPESRNWSFRVPSLGIVGGADTREEAERRVVDAVAFTLEGEEDGSTPSQTEVRYLNVEIAAG
jgi:predicted RNase H-like HicB family nuclease